jgi:nucleotide-binding universal stress UspA family protein
MTVVVGVKDTSGARAALQVAAQEARFRGSRLIAVKAYHEGSTFGAPAGRPLSTLGKEEDMLAAAGELLRDAVCDALGDEADQVDMRVVAGPAGRRLVDVAREMDAELIVLAARGNGAEWLLGTVSQFVLRNAPCPVLIVPETVKRSAQPAGSAPAQHSR